MKKNFLLLILSVVLGGVSAFADMVRIQVDNAANVVVTTQNGANTLTLSDGMNQFDLDASQTPLAIQAAEGAEIVSVIKNNVALSAGGDGIYRSAIEPMMIEITTKGGEPVVKMLKTWLQPNILGAVSITCDGVKTVLSEEPSDYFESPAGKELLIQAEEGYAISNVSYQNSSNEELAVDNGDGTWSVTPDHDYGYMTITAKELGITFSVDVNLAGNVAVIATLKEEDENGPAVTKGLSLIGDGPYQCTAPEGTLYLNFWPADGGEIKSIKRIQTTGAEMDLNYSEYVGWRSTVTEADVFSVNAVGPEKEITFKYLRGPELKYYVATVNDISKNLSEEDFTVKARAGETITIAAGPGATLTGVVIEDPASAKEISNKNGVSVVKIVDNATLMPMGYIKEGITVAVDNATAVIVKQSNGYGDALTLKNGDGNSFENVKNPLKISATEGYRVISVIADGVLIKANADGTYTAEVKENGSLIITTDELPKPLPVTFVVTGDASKLILTQDGAPVEYNPTLLLPEGTELTVTVPMGWKITSFNASNNYSTYDEDSNVYTVLVRHEGSIMITVEEWIAQEGNALVTFNAPELYVSAFELDEKGERVRTLFPNTITEVKIGNNVEVTSYGNHILTSVTANGKEITIDESGKKATFTVEGKTELNVEAGILCSVSGDKTSNPENHSFTGYIYINEEGKYSANVAQGGTFTVLPVAERGYKFAGFSYVYPESLKSQIPDEIKDSYTFTVPEGVESIFFQGAFEAEEDNRKLFTVRGSNCFVNGQVSNDAVVYINVGGNLQMEYNAYEGETVSLTTTGRFENMTIETYCLYYHNQKPISAEYVVNAEDAEDNGTIWVSAKVTTPSGVDATAADTLNYDAATSTLQAPANVKIFDITGALVIEAESGVVSLETLNEGLYIAVCANKTLKFKK